MRYFNTNLQTVKNLFENKILHDKASMVDASSVSALFEPFEEPTSFDHQLIQAPETDTVDLRQRKK